jgi:hypothetical protein
MILAHVRHAPIARQSLEPAIDRAHDAGAAKCCDETDGLSKNLLRIGNVIRNSIQSFSQAFERERSHEVGEGTTMAGMPAHIARPIQCEQRHSSLCDALGVDSMPTWPPPYLIHRPAGLRRGKWPNTIDGAIVAFIANGAQVISHDARAGVLSILCMCTSSQA